MPRFTPEDLKAIYDSQKKPFRVSEEYAESRQGDYVAEMVRQMKEKYKNREKIPPTLTQCASTQAIMDRDPETDVQHYLRPLPPPEKWKAYKGDFAALSPDEQDKAVGYTPRAVDQIAHIESIRRRPKNEIENDDRSATTPQKREAAIHAYTYSPGRKFKDLSPREKQVITAMSGYQAPAPPIQEEPKKKSWWQRLFSKNPPATEIKPEYQEFYDALRRMK